MHPGHPPSMKIEGVVPIFKIKIMDDLWLHEEFIGTRKERNMVNVSVVFMAAGLGTRFGGDKQMAKLGPKGESLMAYGAYDAMNLGAEKLIFVLRKEMEEVFRETLGRRLEKKIPVEVVFQELSQLPQGLSVPKERMKPWGTGHCLYVAKENLGEAFLILNADDYYGKDVLAGLFQALQEGETFVMPGYLLKNTLSKEGPVSRGVITLGQEHQVLSITEREKIFEEDQTVFYESRNGLKVLPEKTYVSMNIFAGRRDALGSLEKIFQEFLEHNVEELTKKEFYLPHAMEALAKASGKPIRMIEAKGPWMGVTYKEDAQRVREKLQALVQTGHYPEDLF